MHQTDRTLFRSDLFFHPGDPEPVTRSDVVRPATKVIHDKVVLDLARVLEDTLGDARRP